MERLLNIAMGCPGRFRVTIPGGVQGRTGCGPGLSHKAVIGQRSDPVVSEVFSNIKDSESNEHTLTRNETQRYLESQTNALLTHG